MRQLLSVVLLIGSLLLSSPSLANSNPELDAFFDNYINSLAHYFDDETGGNIDPVMRFFYPQTLQVPPNTSPRLTKDHHVLGSAFGGFFDQLKQQGAVKLRWEQVQYVKLGESHVWAANTANVLDKDDRLIQRLSSIYSLYKDDAGWRIFLVQPISPNQTPLIEPKTLQ